MIGAPRSSRSRCVTAFTAPCVPTAMKAGVSIAPCGVVSTPRRAAPCVCVTSKLNADISSRTIIDYVKKLRVGIIYGGRSGEHEVSIASAAAVVQNLDKQRYEAIPIRIEKDGRWLLADRLPVSSSAAEVIEHARTHTTQRLGRGGREAHLLAHPGDEQMMTIERGATPSITGLALDVVFPVLHGPYGEDGTVQGLLELANIPYVGAGVLASAVGMDKAMMKLVFAAKGLPICDYEVVLARDWRRDERAILTRVTGRLGFPLFVKPANLGSSVGISKAKHATELRA